MDKIIKVIEYQYVIKAKFNPVKFNNICPPMLADQKSKVMFKSKKTIITVAVILAIIIAAIIFIVVRNKKKKKKLEEEQQRKSATQLPTKRATKPQSAVIPKEDQPGSQPAKTPAVHKPSANGQVVQGNSIPGTITDATQSGPVVQENKPFSPFVETPSVAEAKPVKEQKPATPPITPLRDKGISIENELNKPIDQD